MAPKKPPHEIDPHPYATVTEIAKRVRATPLTVRRWCAEGKVKARKTPSDEWRIFVDAEGWPLEPAVEKA